MIIKNMETTSVTQMPLTNVSIESAMLDMTGIIRDIWVPPFGSLEPYLSPGLDFEDTPAQAS
jgi:hypothetical protein